MCSVIPGALIPTPRDLVYIPEEHAQAPITDPNVFITRVPRSRLCKRHEPRCYFCLTILEPLHTSSLRVGPDTTAPTCHNCLEHTVPHAACVTCGVLNLGVLLDPSTGRCASCINPAFNATHLPPRRMDTAVYSVPDPEHGMPPQTPVSRCMRLMVANFGTLGVNPRSLNRWYHHHMDVGKSYIQRNVETCLYACAPAQTMFDPSRVLLERTQHNGLERRVFSQVVSGPAAIVPIVPARVPRMSCGPQPVAMALADPTDSP